MHQKHDTYTNIINLNHIYNSDEQQIIMAKWRTEYIICLYLINIIQRFFASSS